jgi:hypothetical protein
LQRPNIPPWLPAVHGSDAGSPRCNRIGCDRFVSKSKEFIRSNRRDSTGQLPVAVDCVHVPSRVFVAPTQDSNNPVRRVFNRSWLLDRRRAFSSIRPLSNMRGGIVEACNPSVKCRRTVRLGRDQAARYTPWRYADRSIRNPRKSGDSACKQGLRRKASHAAGWSEAVVFSALPARNEYLPNGELGAEWRAWRC